VVPLAAWVGATLLPLLPLRAHGSSSPLLALQRVASLALAGLLGLLPYLHLPLAHALWRGPGSWGDTTTLMAQSYDALMEGVVNRTEDALTKFIRTGKLGVDDLANYVQDAIARMIAQAAIAQGTKFVGDLISLYSGGFAKGGAFGPSGQITAFANGGVVGSPTYFGYEGGKRKGLMGEAGPEAIIPLARGRDGKLGVRGGGGTAINVTMNVQSGVSRSEVAALLPMLTAQVKAELQGSMRRPGFAG
jgi:phage-related minor tail protein